MLAALASVSLPGSLAAGLVVAFLAGALSFFSPCVLPLVPSYLSLMSGVSTTDLASATRPDQGRLLRATLLFIAGYAVVFTALGAGASVVGSYLITNKVVLQRVSGALIVGMGLVVAGLLRPALLQREARFHLVPRAMGAWAPPVMGAAFAFGWSPCIGPVLGAILGLASTTGSASRGVVLLLSYSLGLGVPFVASGLAFGRLTTTFRWVKRHFGVINLVSGLVLAGFGLLLLTNNLGHVVRFFQDVLDALGLDFLENSL